MSLSLGYASIPAASPYETLEYAGARPFLQPRLTHSHQLPSSGSHDQPNVFSVDDSAVAWQTFPNYPVMQPSRSITQPMTSREEMIYPQPVPSQGYTEQSEVQPSSPDSPGTQVVDPQPYPSALAEKSEGQVRRFSAIQTGVILEDDEHVELRPSADLDIVHPNQKPPPSRRGPFRNLDDRQRTAETRRIGSCIRCRMQRIRVSSR